VGEDAVAAAAGARHHFMMWQLQSHVHALEIRLDEEKAMRRALEKQVSAAEGKWWREKLRATGLRWEVHAFR